MFEPAPQRRDVFISYARADREWVERLQRMMKPLLRAAGQQIALWDDSQIEVGAQWRPAIETALAQAKVALLLVSDAFLASEFVMNDEVPKLLAAAEAEGVRVLWVSLSPCLVEHTPIHAYQAVLDPGRPLAAMNAVEQEEALVEIAEEVHRALKEGPARQRHLEEQQPARELELQPNQPRSIRWRTRWRRWREPLAEGVELLMAWIPADPAKQQREYLLASEPISLRQWQVVAGWPAEGEELNPDPSEHHAPDQPVNGISHPQALEFCRRLATHSGRYYELPSHEQWEHACRAGSTSAYSWGEAWSASLAADTANAWGLRQMQGGLWEWCQEGGLRGGSWKDPPERRQCGSRAEASEPLHPSTVGLRVCCLPLGTPVHELKASRQQWRPPVTLAACEEVLGQPLSEAQFTDLQRGLRRFRIATAPQLRLFFGLLADRLGAGANDPRHPLRSDEAAAAEAFAEALADPAVALGGPGWSERYPYSSAAFLWQRDGWRQRAERAVGPEAFWAELALGGAERQQAFAAACQRAQLRFGAPR